MEKPPDLCPSDDEDEGVVKSKGMPQMQEMLAMLNHRQRARDVPLDTVTEKNKGKSKGDKGKSGSGGKEDAAKKRHYN